jgi:uncharacterized LabA/DUF88 family protein
LREEPFEKRVYAFVDGQNLYHAVKAAYGYTYPNYDPLLLSKSICNSSGWSLIKVNFYTGVPKKAVDPLWQGFWEGKIAEMGKRGIKTFTRTLRYSNENVTLPDGRETTVLVGREKGIDVRIALDVVRTARQNLYDVALIFSQDQDLSEVAKEVREISLADDRWIKVACAFPTSPTLNDPRGINGTDWIPIERSMYDACLDPLDYRPRK